MLWMDFLRYPTSDSRHGCSTIITLTSKFGDGKIKPLQDIMYNRMQYACSSTFNQIKTSKLFVCLQLFVYSYETNDYLLLIEDISGLIHHDAEERS